MRAQPGSAAPCSSAMHNHAGPAPAHAQRSGSVPGVLAEHRPSLAYSSTERMCVPESAHAEGAGPQAEGRATHPTIQSAEVASRPTIQSIEVAAGAWRWVDVVESAGVMSDFQGSDHAPVWLSVRAPCLATLRAAPRGLAASSLTRFSVCKQSLLQAAWGRPAASALSGGVASGPGDAVGQRSMGSASAGLMRPGLGPASGVAVGPGATSGQRSMGSASVGLLRPGPASQSTGVPFCALSTSSVY